MEVAFVLAHGSGIDDVLWFAIPVLLAFAWLRRSERKAAERAESEEDQTAKDPAAGT